MTSPTRRTLLVVDDDAAIRRAVRYFFEHHGFRVLESGDCADAERLRYLHAPDLAVVDYRLPDGTALDLLARWRANKVSLPLVVLTGHGSIDLAVRTIKEGADNFITKPLELEALRVVVERILENEHNRRVHRSARSRGEREVVDPFVGPSTAIARLRTEVHKLVSADSPMLILGETGVGKGVLAAWLHHHGPRSAEPFVDINCAGLSKELLESELFGHEKGAFTGATRSKTGLLEVAHRGTVFLDEIGDLDLTVQPKLLKVLEEKRFRRLGETGDRRVDIRLIAATHHDLGRRVAEGAFRSDLYFRLNTIPLTVPPLRERPEDIPALAQHFVDGFARRRGLSHLELAEAAQDTLQAYSWPGNVRELRNVLERAVLLAEGRTLEPGDLRFEVSLAASPGDRGHPEVLTLEQMEIQHIERALRVENGHVGRAARRLAVPRSTLYQRIKTLGIVRHKT